MELSRIDLTIAKKQARKSFLQARSVLSEKDIATMSQAICDNLLKELDKLSVRTVLLFSPVRREPDIFPLTDLLNGIGIHTALPVSHKKDIRLEFRYIKSSEDLVIGEYGIREPSEKCDTVTDFLDCVCIVPALAFDKKGMRIGYGKGYYDRFLKDFNGISIGVAFSNFVAEELPVEDTDIAIDLIVTEGGVIIPNEKEYAPPKLLKKS